MASTQKFDPAWLILNNPLAAPKDLFRAGLPNREQRRPAIMAQFLARGARPVYKAAPLLALILAGSDMFSCTPADESAEAAPTSAVAAALRKSARLRGGSTASSRGAASSPASARLSPPSAFRLARERRRRRAPVPSFSRISFCSMASRARSEADFASSSRAGGSRRWRRTISRRRPERRPSTAAAGRSCRA